jgi:hypothetical protein
LVVKRAKKTPTVITEKLVCGDEWGVSYSSAQSNLPEEVVNIQKLNMNVACALITIRRL